MKPIIMSGESVRAILAGRKTQTRRVVSLGNTLIDGHRYTSKDEFWGHKDFWRQFDFESAWIDPGPSPAGNPGPYLKAPFPPEGTAHRLYPTWQPGDELRVKEPFFATAHERADYEPDGGMRPEPVTEYGPPYAYAADGDAPTGMTPRNAMFMPKDASRLTLRLTDVRVERLQEISRGDCMEEGYPFQNLASADPVGWFASLWDSINAHRAPWASNPWVWVLEFRKEG